MFERTLAKLPDVTEENGHFCFSKAIIPLFALFLNSVLVLLLNAVANAHVHNLLHWYGYHF